MTTLSPYILPSSIREAAVAEFKLRAICKAAAERFGNVAPLSQVRAAANHRVRALAALAVRLGVSLPRDPFAALGVGIPAYVSISHACMVGAAASRHSIASYEKLLGLDLPPGVAEAITRMLDATRHHDLPAFERSSRPPSRAAVQAPSPWSA